MKKSWSLILLVVLVSSPTTTYAHYPSWYRPRRRVKATPKEATPKAIAIPTTHIRELIPYTKLIELIDKSVLQKNRTHAFNRAVSKVRSHLEALKRDIEAETKYRQLFDSRSKIVNSINSILKREVLTKNAAISLRNSFRSFVSDVEREHTVFSPVLSNFTMLGEAFETLLQPNYYSFKGIADYIMASPRLAYSHLSKFKSHFRDNPKKAVFQTLLALNAVLVSYVVLRKEGKQIADKLRENISVIIGDLRTMIDSGTHFATTARQGTWKGLLSGDLFTYNPFKDEGVRFDDIIGLDDVVAQLKSIIASKQDFAAIQRAKKLGLSTQKGILLEGPPGVGKTMLAKAFANESKSSFFYMSATEFRDMWLGGGGRKVRQLFNKAKQSAPSVIFIDEIDAIGKKRTGTGGAAQGEVEATLNEILTQMDGFKEAGDITVITATNMADKLDPALTSRFPQKVKIGLPNEGSRAKILEHYLNKLPLHQDIQPPRRKKVILEELARATAGLSARLLKALIDGAAGNALLEKRDMVTADDLFIATYKSLLGENLNIPEAIQARMEGDYVPGKTRTKRRVKKDVTFDDIVGLEDVVTEMRAIIEQTSDPEQAGLAAALGVTIPKGFLLEGPPGIGKTMLAKAFANESNSRFFYASATSFVEQYVGLGAKRVRELFAKARDASPSIVFIDEIDAVGAQRGQTSSGGTKEIENTLNELLTQMEGFDDDEPVMVLAATNRADMLDDALRSRFSKIITFSLPDEQTRAGIIEHYLRQHPLAENMDLQRVAAQIAKHTDGFSSRNLSKMVENAVRKAFQIRQRFISEEEIYLALNEMRASKRMPHVSLASDLI